MKALLCGRGTSLSYYKKLNETYDYIYLINEFNRFIVEDPDLLNFFKTQQSNGAKFIQQVNIEMAGLDQNIVNRINFHECNIARLAKKENCDSIWRENIDVGRFIRRGINLKVNPQPESVGKFLLDDRLDVCNSMQVAALNAYADKQCSEISVIGSDFYEADYYLSHRGLDWHSVSSLKTQNRLKSGFTKLVNVLSDVNFKIYTNSSFTHPGNHCEITDLRG